MGESLKETNSGVYPILNCKWVVPVNSIGKVSID